MPICNYSKTKYNCFNLVIKFLNNSKNGQDPFFWKGITNPIIKLKKNYELTYKYTLPR